MSSVIRIESGLVKVNGKQFDAEKPRTHKLSNAELKRAYELYYMSSRSMLRVSYIPKRCRNVRVENISCAEFERWSLSAAQGHIRFVEVRVNFNKVKGG